MSNLNFLDYELPPARIAQRPAAFFGEPRSRSKLLHARSGAEPAIEDRVFEDLREILRPGDLLVLNNTRVMPCRFFARREEREGEFEMFLLSKIGEGCGGFPIEIWEALGRPLKKLKAGDRLLLSERLTCEVLGRREEGRKLELKLWAAGDGAGKTLSALIAEDALMPIPPYIRDGHSDLSDKMLYQTVFAETPGSVAAPTAGLHFTPELLSALEALGVEHRFITLHVGQASITMVPEGPVEQFQMPSESYSISDKVWEEIVKRKGQGRIVTVGTTTTRALESYAQLPARERDGRPKESRLFIRPGFEFKVTDGLITNFHQPRSTHLLLVAAFIGCAETEAIYQHALRGEYRFLSYGDAMLLERQERR